MSDRLHLSRWLWALALLCVGTAARAATTTFDFNTPPSSTFNPTFVSGGFTLSHPSDAANGDALWANNAMSMYNDSSFAPARTSMVFSEPVNSVRFFVTVHSIDPVKFIPIVDYGEGSAERPEDTVTVTLSQGANVEVVFAAADTQYRGVTIMSDEYPSSTSGFVTWDNLTVQTSSGPSYPPDSLSLQDVPVVPNGNEPVPLLELDHFRSTAAKVTSAGSLDADFCIAPDPRETTFKGKPVYVFRVLLLSELADKGTCTGNVAHGAATPGGIGTWAHLLTAARLSVAPWFRSFKGRVKSGPLAGQTGNWIVIGSIRSTAGYDGPVGVLPVPEDLIDYGSQLDTTKGDPAQLKCNTNLDNRPLTLGGTVAAFGEFMNVEGGLMIQESVQCDGPVSMTRRTTHAYPMRLDGLLLDEAVNVATILGGLQQTFSKAAVCTNQGYLTKPMQADLDAAKLAILLRQWNTAIAKLEDFAIRATGLAYGGCPAGSNYKGGLVARSITAAFTVHDRFKYRAAGTNWQTYYPPSQLDLPLIFDQPSE